MIQYKLQFSTGWQNEEVDRKWFMQKSMYYLEKNFENIFGAKQKYAFQMIDTLWRKISQNFKAFLERVGFWSGRILSQPETSHSCDNNPFLSYTEGAGFLFK